MKNACIATAALLINSLSFSQQKPAIEKELWTEKPALHATTKEQEKESAVVISDVRKVEFVDDAQGNVISYKTLHKIIHVNDDKGIEAFNKVYLPVADNSELEDIRARTILPGGKIVELDKTNIKDFKEDERQYKIFAMEGLQKGCEVEYFYTYKKNASFFGREVLQTRVPVLLSRLTIVAPERLLFDIRCFNNTAIPTDTIFNAKHHFTVALSNLAGAEDEKYANMTVNMARAEFKLSYNSAKNRSERLFTWNELASRIYQNYTSFTPKETKKAGELLDDNGWDKLSSEKEKIIAVENFIKKNIGTREDISGDDAENIEKIIKNKIASHTGIVRLYAIIYGKLGIDIQFVLTGDRSEYILDKSFENWSNCENELIYFPAEKKYIAPTRVDFRYPWIEPAWGNTFGLFCKTTTIGTFTTALAEIRKIALEDYTQSSSNIDAAIELNGSMDTLLVRTSQSQRGYLASFYRAVFNFAAEEQQKKYVKDFVKFGTNSENIVSTEIKNKDFESYPDNKPFTLTAVVKASELVEKAGNKVLVKIGEIIGPQVEMYQEKPRQFPIEVQYPHVLQRRIEFTLPSGYNVKNLNDLAIKSVYEENGQLTMGFVSSYKQDGNKVIVDIMEEYRNSSYPLSQYEEFKKIINASADFNKIILVLEKKAG